MGNWRVDIVLNVEKILCGILESGYSVNCRGEFLCGILESEYNVNCKEEFVSNIGEWMKCEM